MKKVSGSGSGSSHGLGTFLSPNYRENGAFKQKGWCSERVPHPSSSSRDNSTRRHIGSVSALTTPFYSGRTLPSKWEDAERWICSPVSLYPEAVGKKDSMSFYNGEDGGDGSSNSGDRRQKSKSGPIVQPTGGFCYSSCSPAMNVLEAGNMRGLMAGSPFSTGVIAADRVYGGGDCGSARNGGGNFGGRRLACVSGWSDLVSEASLPSSQEEKGEDNKGAIIMVSPVVSRRDMATQMSSEDISPSRRSFFCSSPPLILSVVDPPQHDVSPKVSIVREVTVDKRATMIKRSKRHGSRVIKRGVSQPDSFYKTITGSSASSWDISEPAMSISKMQREEAGIAAWENLQKAKAEAAIRKLEVKLEKKKSESMDKILTKLKTAQLRAEEMRRSTISNKQEVEIQKTQSKLMIKSFYRHLQMGSLRSCFTGHHAV